RLDLADPLVRVDQDRRYRQRHERHEHGKEPDAGQCHHEQYDTDRGQGAGRVGGVDHQEPAAVGVPDEHAQRYRDDDREQQRDTGVVQVLAEAGRYAVGPAPLRRLEEPAPGVPESAHALSPFAPPGQPMVDTTSGKLWSPGRAEATTSGKLW